ncbi:hypothetical protein QJQ45_023626 [Haematococcus lacustris]|nr:hypothetical protein QJQ45_023626 [Haematococcus lacustris]
MGNLCGTQAGALAAAASGLEGSDKGSVAQEPYKPAAPSSVPSRPVAATPADPIQVALGNAKVELAKNVSQKFEDVYSISKLIGHGAFAKVSICTHLSSNAKYAVKVVQKNIEDPVKQREGILKEIAIMRMLEDHPNTVRLLEVFEDADSYMLVMELCTGGELFDQIIAKGHFSEKDAAEKMHCLLDFIANAHSKNIIHRDLKPENILLSDKSPTAAIKVIDFGTSDFCAPGQRLSQKFGTPYYVAPEVLRKDYNTSADIWSAGVIMYILLCGYPPFGGKTDAKILQRVQAGKCVSSHTQRQLGVFSFEGREWEVVTEAAKDMISSMLVMDFTQRAQAKQLLTHRWFQVAATAPAAALGAHMVKRLRAFAGMSRMKRLALVVLARTLTDNDVKRLRELFAAMDTNNDGRIDSQDLHNALEKVGAAIAESEMQELFHASDIDGTGQIDYEEFIAAMLDSNRVARRKEAVRKSFEELDKDGDGFITAEDLVKVMPRGSSIELAREMVEEVDRNGDGRVDYNEVRKTGAALAVPTDDAILRLASHDTDVNGMMVHGDTAQWLCCAARQRICVGFTLLFSMAKKKRRTVPKLVPEDPDSDIEDRDEALQPDLTEAQQNRKASGEARAARDRDNTYHGRKCKIAHLIDHLPQELWDAFLADAVQPRVEAISERAVLASLLFGLLVRGLFTIRVADPLGLHDQPVYRDIPVSQAAIPDLSCRNLFLQLVRGLPGNGAHTRPNEAVAAVLAAHPDLRARLAAIPRHPSDTNMVDHVGKQLETAFSNMLTILFAGRLKKSVSLAGQMSCWALRNTGADLDSGGWLGPAAAPCGAHHQRDGGSHGSLAAGYGALASYRQFADTVLATYDAMWAEVTKPRWANAKFRLYCGKMRVVASFWAKVKKQAQKRWPDRILALAYGAASFSGSGSIGCRGVPVSQMRKEAVKQFGARRVVLVDEFRTSRVSSAYSSPIVVATNSCFEGTHATCRPALVLLSTIRVFLYYTKNTYRYRYTYLVLPITAGQPPETFRFYDRDVSAALNIRRCAVGPGPRPTELCYWDGRPAMPKPGRQGQEWVYLRDKALLRTRLGTTPDEAQQPEVPDVQRKRKASGEARASRDSDNTYHGRKCKLAHLTDHLPQEPSSWLRWHPGFLVPDLFSLHVADPLDLHGQPVYTDIPVSQAAIPDLGCRNLYLRLCRGLPGDGDNTRPSAAVAAVLAAYPDLRARLVAIPRYHFDTNMVDTSDLFCVIRNDRNQKLIFQAWLSLPNVPLRWLASAASLKKSVSLAGAKALVGTQEPQRRFGAMQQQAPPVQRLSPGDTAGVKARIAADFEQGYIVTGIIDTAIYDPDCYFADPTVAFSGLALWQRNLQLLLPFLIQPSVRLLHMKEVKTQEGLPPQLRAEWELRTHLALPWRPLIAILGATDYYLNSDGNQVTEASQLLVSARLAATVVTVVVAGVVAEVVEHVETWNVSGAQAVAQIFKPSELSLWRLHR